MDISKIDKNFETKENLEKQDVRFWDVLREPFSVHGVYFEDGMFRRMPAHIAKSVSEQVYILHTHCAGGRIRFATDSDYVAIHAKWGTVFKMAHFTFAGSCGFDLYADGVFAGSYIAPFEKTQQDADYCAVIDLGEKKMREITINLPLYSEVKEFHIGLCADANVQKAKPYKNEKPVVYYGSSITQGACASRPGMCYQNIISRRFDLDYINLGFSGSAKAEQEIIDYIAGLDMPLFVYDYDHNAPTPEYLDATHEKMFLQIREKHPNLPVIMMSRPSYFISKADADSRFEIIKKTYENAKNAGDKNVYLIDGRRIISACGGDATVDSVHPTDYGFAAMADAVCEILYKIDLAN